MNNNIIRHPKYDDKHNLIDIWKSSFSDNDNFIKGFFDSCFVPQNCFAYYLDNKPVSMLFMLDCNVHVHDINYNAMYIYAVATLPEFRNMGIMRSLEKEVCKFCIEKEKDFVILIPQDQKLFNMYEKLGYKTTFFNAYKSYKRSDFALLSEMFDFVDLSQQEFLLKRKNLLEALGCYVMLNDKFDDFVCKSNVLYNFNAYSVNDDYILGFKNNDEFEIIESSIKYKKIDIMLPSIFNKFKVDKISFKNILEKNFDLKPYGMVKALKSAVYLNVFTGCKPPCYMNLMLD